MKRLTMFLIALALTAMLLNLDIVSAQSHNCFHRVTNGTGSTRYYRGLQGSTLVTDVIAVPAGSTGVLTIKKGTTGSINYQSDTSPTFGSPAAEGSFLTSCVDDNKEFGVGCGNLGVDLYNFSVSGASLVLRVFKGSDLVLTQSYAPTGFFNIQVIVPGAANDPNAFYSYDLRCVGGGTCAAGNSGPISGSPAPGTLVMSGQLTYICQFACGPSLDGAPLGRMNATVPLYWAPRADAASTFRAEAGKTFKILGQQGGFTRIALACQAYWVPSDSIAQCADPLCR